MILRDKTYNNRDQFLWTDLPDAKRTLAERRCATRPETIDIFIDHGYTTISSAVSTQAIEFFQRELYATLARPDSPLIVTYWDQAGKHQVQAKAELLGEREAKVLDVHHHLPSSHPLIFSPTLIAFLRDVFEDDPVAFQTLYFEHGSTQGAHNDTAFVYVDPPAQFVASWIALEDIAPNTGELFYFPGSHKMGDQIFANGGKAFDPADEHADCYSAELERMAASKGLSRATFVPRQTDVLFWAADLVHGGSQIVTRRTRRSLVTHYCPLHATVPYARHLGKQPQPVGEGGWIVSAT
jgi:ectoine hydroxylase-related dioxygenase (phytanoyl-CoA dioxygenase family)